MEETLEQRLAALERELTDGTHDCSALAEGAAAADRVTDIEAELDDLTDRVAELEAATQALRGYVGNVRSVNTDVEERADLALSKAEAARRAVDRAQSSPDRETARDPEPSDCGRDTPESSVRRCEHCDQPLNGETPSSPTQSGSESPDPRLANLRDGNDTRPVGTSALAGAQTDGGLTSGQTDEEHGNGILARVRTLL